MSEHNQKMTLVGVMSSGNGCGRPNSPGIYTNVQSYLGWINETISRWDEAGARNSCQHWTGADIDHVERSHLLKRDVESIMSVTQLPGLSMLRQSSL